MTFQTCLLWHFASRTQRVPDWLWKDTWMGVLITSLAVNRSSNTALQKDIRWEGRTRGTGTASFSPSLSWKIFLSNTLLQPTRTWKWKRRLPMKTSSWRWKFQQLNLQEKTGRRSYLRSLWYAWDFSLRSFSTATQQANVFVSQILLQGPFKFSSHSTKLSWLLWWNKHMEKNITVKLSSNIWRKQASNRIQLEIVHFLTLGWYEIKICY